ncbi:anthranilate synthase component 1, partial [Elasticomyces elasticus]
MAARVCMPFGMRLRSMTDHAQVSVHPPLEDVRDLLSAAIKLPHPPNLVPLCASVSSEFLTPSAVYLKISAKSKSKLSFLFESAATTETIGRYSFVGADPRKVLKTGPGHGEEVDPLPLLDTELSQCRVAHIPTLKLPPLTGGAIGYVGYDCVRYFEPRTKRPMKDVLKVPESFFMLYDTIVAIDHFMQRATVVTYLHVPSDLASLPAAYEAASKTLKETIRTLTRKDVPFPYPDQSPIKKNNEYTSNIGRPGYEAHVKRLKTHIECGDIIQAVPSQRIARPTSLHPFNIYRHLRT